MGSGRVDSGVSTGTGEFLDGALGPSGTGLEKRQAGLIFSHCSKYCPPLQYWESSHGNRAFPEILCLGGG